MGKVQYVIRFLSFCVYRLEPDELTSCNDMFSCGNLLTLGSLIDSPSIFIKDESIIIRGMPNLSINKMFQENISPTSHFKVYLDEHPQYLIRGRWYVPFNFVKLPTQGCKYGRVHLLPKTYLDRLLIIETEKYLFVFAKAKKQIEEAYVKLVQWKENCKKRSVIRQCEYAFHEMESEGIYNF